MSSCPHPAHATPKQVVWDHLPISFCRDGRNQAFFLWAIDLMNGPATSHLLSSLSSFTSFFFLHDRDESSVLLH